MVARFFPDIAPCLNSEWPIERRSSQGRGARVPASSRNDPQRDLGSRSSSRGRASGRPAGRRGDCRERRRSPGIRAKAVRQISNRCDLDGYPIAAVESRARRTDAHHTILKILLAEVVEDLVLQTSVARDLGSADKGRTSCGTYPHENRAAAFDALGLPSVRPGLNQDGVVISAGREPHRRSLALIAVLANGGHVDEARLG